MCFARMLKDIQLRRDGVNGVDDIIPVGKRELIVQRRQIEQRIRPDDDRRIDGVNPRFGGLHLQHADRFRGCQ